MIAKIPIWLDFLKNELLVRGFNRECHGLHPTKRKIRISMALWLWLIKSRNALGCSSATIRAPSSENGDFNWWHAGSVN
jgi:hypothetical protein